jgi:hypothetical protein
LGGGAGIAYNMAGFLSTHLRSVPFYDKGAMSMKIIGVIALVGLLFLFGIVLSVLGWIFLFPIH